MDSPDKMINDVRKGRKQSVVIFFLYYFVLITSSVALVLSNHFAFYIFINAFVIINILIAFFILKEIGMLRDATYILGSLKGNQEEIDKFMDFIKNILVSINIEKKNSLCLNNKWFYRLDIFLGSLVVLILGFGGYVITSFLFIFLYLTSIRIYFLISRLQCTAKRLEEDETPQDFLNKERTKGAFVVNNKYYGEEEREEGIENSDNGEGSSEDIKCCEKDR